MATTTTSTSATPTARPRGEARRAALLDATLRVIADAGADAVTHRRVAEEAGLPLASTTYWFDSKEHLLTAALQHASELDLERLRAAAETAGDGDGAVSTAEVVAVIFPAADRSTGRGSLLATYSLLLEAARRPALQEISRRWTEAYLDTVGDLLARAGSSRPREDARLLIAAADGLAIDALATGAPDPADVSERLCRVAGALIAQGAPR